MPAVSARVLRRGVDREAMALDHRPVDGLGALLTVIVVLGALALAQWGELRR